MRRSGVVLLAALAALAGTALAVVPFRGASAGQTAAVPAFTDSFDGAVDRDPTYGLNDAIATRQTGTTRGVTYRRVSGVWYPAPAPRPWYSQVNHPAHPGALSFWLGTSAVRLEAPVVADAGGQVEASVTTDPVTGDRASGSWSSLVLTDGRTGSGYVTDHAAVLGVLVRSTGAVQVFHRGQLVAQSQEPATSADGRFRITVRGTPGQSRVAVQVGSMQLGADLPSALPASTWLHLGAYLADDKLVTTFDDLTVSALGEPVDAIAASRLRYFGYFAARITDSGGNHLSEVKGRTNLNWVNISDFSRYAPEVLADCAPGSCMVYTGHEFFTGCTKENDPVCDLYPDYRDRWLRLAKVVEPYLDRIAGFYLKDEPYHRGAAAEEVAASARAIKDTYPDKAVMLVEAGPKVTSAMVVPPEVDWVGFDWYCQPMEVIEQTLRTLESRTTDAQQLFLLPQSTPVEACGTKPGYQTDAELAVLQRRYAELAARHPRVIGLMGFGLWVEATPASSLPETIDIHERLAARILTNPSR